MGTLLCFNFILLLTRNASSPSQAWSWSSFGSTFGRPDWIKTAEELVKDEYVSRYKDRLSSPDMKDDGGPDPELCDGYYLFQ